MDFDDDFDGLDDLDDIDFGDEFDDESTQVSKKKSKQPKTIAGALQKRKYRAMKDQGNKIFSLNPNKFQKVKTKTTMEKNFIES